ncbi:mismatch-specific DNA-glycosylase [Microbacterium maritypicum]|uniref:mismatch-specific DNA-glycosylase n=1 Tax=Microbacterium maritypicum TaxID=33918 RepID=UPI0037FBF101
MRMGEADRNVGKKYTRLALLGFAGGTLPDLLAEPTQMLIVGINPGLLSVAVQAHFAPRSNRFYKALHLAGITDRVIDASEGFESSDIDHLRRRGIGITSMVRGASARASDLTAEELRAGGKELRRRVSEIRPRVVAMLGVSAYRIAFDEPSASVGLQSAPLGGPEIWVVPNPSGLNRRYSVSDLAHAYRQVALRAGIEPFERSGHRVDDGCDKLRAMNP